MQKVFGGSGLQLFVPEVELKAGDDLKSAGLSPATVEERPLLTAAPSYDIIMWVVCFPQYRGFSKWGAPKWMVYNGESH